MKLVEWFYFFQMDPRRPLPAFSQNVQNLSTISSNSHSPFATPIPNITSLLPDTSVPPPTNNNMHANYQQHLRQSPISTLNADPLFGHNQVPPNLQSREFNEYLVNNTTSTLPPNMPAPNMPAPNIPAPNIPAPNIPAPNMTSPNMTVPNMSIPNMPETLSDNNASDMFSSPLLAGLNYQSSFYRQEQSSADLLHQDQIAQIAESLANMDSMNFQSLNAEDQLSQVSFILVINKSFNIYSILGAVSCSWPTSDADTFLQSLQYF